MSNLPAAANVMAKERPHPLVWSYPLYVQERGLVVDWTKPYPNSVVMIDGDAVLTGSWEECCNFAEDMVRHG